MTRSYQESSLATKQRRAFEPNQTQTNDRLVETPHAIGPLLKLRAAAAESPAARNLQSLQRKADARTQIQPPPRAAMRGVARDLPLPSLQRKSTRGSMATSPSAMAASLHPSNNQGPAIFGIPNANEIALQRIATTAQDTVPGQPMAVDLPLLDALGMTARSMSNEEYAQWSETVQCKMGVHGKHQMGDRTIVTQFIGWPEWMKTVGRFFLKHKAKFNAGLVIVEAGLTIAAALTGLSAASSVGALNLMLSSIVGCMVGVAKLIRGLMMMRQAFQKQEDKSELTSAVIEAIRTTEAIGSAVALGIAAPNAIPIIAGTVFAAAKALRSFIAVYNDILAEEISRLETSQAEGNAEAIAALKTKQRKAQIAMTVVHAIESAAVLVGGSLALTAGLQGGSELGSAMDNAKEIGGSIALGVGGSKLARTALGYPYKTDDPDAEPETVSPDDPIAEQDPNQVASSSTPAPPVVVTDEGNIENTGLADLVNDQEQIAKVEQ